MAEIGSTLREARMRARIDISEVEARTKIRAKYLRAIENEEWDLLPGAVYVKSFLRTYGDFLGLDSRLLLDEFKRRYERPDDHETRSMASSSRERERERRPSRGARIARGSMSPRVVIVMALVVIVAALYVIGSNANNGGSTAGGKVATSGGRHASTGGKHDHGGKPSKGKGSGKGSGKGPGAAKTNTGTNTNTTPTPPPATFQLTATALIWVCVEGPARKLLIPGLEYTAGKTASASGTALWVSLGNREATLMINGKPYTPPDTDDPIGLKITATTITPISNPPDCRQ